jgi:hypothetical protein
MKDKFRTAISGKCFSELAAEIAAEKCEEIADEYAFGFLNFSSEYECHYNLQLKKVYWINKNDKNKQITTKQLLEIYKQSLK